MGFNEFATAVAVILAVIGALMIVMNFIDKIKAWLKPSQEKEISVTEKLKKHDEMLDRDNKRISALENDMEMMLQSILVLIGHEITGNSIDKLKDTQLALQEYLIKR